MTPRKCTITLATNHASRNGRCFQNGALQLPHRHCCGYVDYRLRRALPHISLQRQAHTETALVQTISRVNRKYAGKDYGYIVDYIGIHDNMMQAMRTYGGDDFGPSEDDVQQALSALVVELDLISKLFTGFDITPFTNPDTKPLDRLECLSDAANYV